MHSRAFAPSRQPEGDTMQRGSTAPFARSESLHRVSRDCNLQALLSVRARSTHHGVCLHGGLVEGPEAGPQRARHRHQLVQLVFVRAAPSAVIARKTCRPSTWDMREDGVHETMLRWILWHRRRLLFPESVAAALQLSR